MVTNLPPEAREKFAKYQEARTAEEKLRALQELLSAVPKHKGTENLVRWIRRRMAELREEAEERRRRKGGARESAFAVERQGAAQVVMLGFTKAGKSSILARLTNARAAPSDVPYSTRVPVPGMLQYQDVQFQLVEAPSIVRGERDSRWNRRSLGLLRNADGALLVVDLSGDPAGDLAGLLEILEEEGVKVLRPRGWAVVERDQGAPGIRVVRYGRLVDGSEDDVRKVLEGYRIYRATVKIYGEARLEDVEDAVAGITIYRPSIVLGNKADLDPGGARCSGLTRGAPAGVPVICCSALTGQGLEGLGKEIFGILGIVRVYTKPPNGEPSKKPLILRRGSTVLDVAKAVHRDLYRGFRHARIWGPSANYPGERVGGDHVVEDGDVVEIRSSLFSIP